MRVVCLFIVAGLASSYVLPPSIWVSRSSAVLFVVLTDSDCHERGQRMYPNALQRRWSLFSEISDNSNHELPGVDELSKLTVEQLKQYLRSRGLPVSGRKSELVDRLINGKSTSTKNPKSKRKETQSKTSESGYKSPTAESLQSDTKSTSRANASKVEGDGSKDILSMSRNDIGLLKEATLNFQKTIPVAKEKNLETLERCIDDSVVGVNKDVDTEVNRQKKDATETTPLPLNDFLHAVPKILTDKEEMELADRLATIESIGERAFEVLKALGMVHDSTSVDPESSDYDNSSDNEIADDTTYLN